MLTTHYMDEAEALCDRVAIMDHGKVLRLDTPRQLIRSLDAPTRITVAAGQLHEVEAGSIPGVEKVHTEIDGLVLTTRAPADVLTRLAEGGRSTGSRCPPAPSRTSSST